MLKRLLGGSVIALAAALTMVFAGPKEAEAIPILSLGVYEWQWTGSNAGICWKTRCQVVRGQGSCCIMLKAT